MQLLLTMASALACDLIAPTELMERLEKAERRFGDLDSDAFLDQTADLSQQLPCLNGTLTPVQASHIHRVFGIRAWLGHQKADARSAFAAAKSADPDYVFPFWMLPESHELRDVYAEAESERAILPVLRPREGQLLFDGRPNDVRPQLQPVMLQIADGSGTIQTSSWIRPADGLPAYKATHPILPPLVGSAKTLRTGLLVTTIGATLLAGGAYGMALGANDRFNKAPDRPTVFGSQDFANAMVVTSAVSGGVAVVSISGAFAVGRF